MAYDRKKDIHKETIEALEDARTLLIADVGGDLMGAALIYRLETIIKAVKGKGAQNEK